MARGLGPGAVEPQLVDEGGQAVLPHIADDAVGSRFGFRRAVGHAAPKARSLQHPDVVGGVACRHRLGEGDAHGLAQIGKAHALVHAAPHDIVKAPAVGQGCAHLHPVQAKVAEFLLKPGQRRRRQHRKGGVGHILQMAVLVFAVQAVQARGVHL